MAKSLLRTYALPGSELLGQKIAAEFESPAAPYCVVLQNHRSRCRRGHTGQSVSAVRSTLEFTANTIINACTLGEVRYLTEEQMTLSKKPRNILPEHPAEQPSIRERELPAP